MAYELAIDGILYIEIKEKTSSSVTFRIYTEGINEVYVGNCALFLYSSDGNGNTDEYIKHEEFYLAHDQIDITVTFDSLSPSTKYWAKFTDYPDGNYYNEWFDFTTLSNTSEINGYKYTISVTTTTATITVTSTKTNEAGTYYYDLYRTDGHVGVASDRVDWNGNPDMPFIYSFDSLEPNITYELHTGNESLGVIYFTTEKADIVLEVLEVTSNSIYVTGGKEVEDYFDHYWRIRKADGTWNDNYGADGRSCRFTNLESGTKYYITLEYCISVSTDTWITTSVEATTLSIGGLFSWTYAGKKKNDDGTYEPVLGENKGNDGTNGAEYFYLTADEWNEYVRKLCETKDEQSATGGVFVEEELPNLEVEPNDVFTAKLYNKVREILYSMDGIEEDEVSPNDSVTANCLNSIKDRLNVFLES